MNGSIKKTNRKKLSREQKAKEASAVYPAKRKTNFKPRQARLKQSIPTQATDAELLEERRVNNLAYQRLKPELEKQYPGKWVCIADGKFQSAAKVWTDLNSTAPKAKHRIITQMGASQLRRIHLPFRYRVGRFVR